MDSSLSVPFVKERQKHFYICFGNARKFSPSGSVIPYGISHSLFLSFWLQSRKIVEKETLLKLGTVLALTPDRSKYKLQINFCCLLAKYYIWLGKHKRIPPKFNNFLRYMKHIDEIENKANTFSQKKWDPIKPFL